MVFFLFCVLVDRPTGEAIGPPAPRFPPGCATAVETVLHFIITHIYFFPSPYSDNHDHELALATVADPENFGGGGDNKKFNHKTSKIRMSSPKLRLIFRPKSEIQTFFPPKTKWSPKKKKGPVFSEIQTFFPPKIRWS